MNYYAEKGKTYFSSYREDLFTVIKGIGKFERALDIGCGNGNLIVHLKNERIVKSCAGIDPYGKLPAGNNIDDFYADKVENVLPKIKSKTFDLIIFSDVLEHLEDPWAIFNYICQTNLEKKGIVVISIPNFRNFLTLGEIILRNSFNYKAEGVLDRTHMRFFCKNDIVAMLNDAGLQIVLLSQKFKFEKTIGLRKNRLKIINNITFNMFPFWLTDQIIAVARKPDA